MNVALHFRMFGANIMIYFCQEFPVIVTSEDLAEVASPGRTSSPKRSIVQRRWALTAACPADVEVDQLVSNRRNRDATGRVMWPATEAPVLGQIDGCCGSVEELQNVSGKLETVWIQ